jgi:SAM-dependent methyltransferase
MTTTSAFDRAGYAALADLARAEHKALFNTLESVQAEFLARVGEFRDPRYGWDSDTLHNWSRAWEYAYFLHHLTQERSRLDGTAVAVDFGSGSTFFPFAVARTGINVTALDIDPIVVGDLQAAARVLSAAPGTLRVLQNDERLPVDDASADIVYSVSVLEHMPDPVPIVREIDRILKPGGLFVLTMDIDVEGTGGVSATHFEALRGELTSRFTYEYAERTIHPAEMLTSKNSPWPRPGERHVPGLMLRTSDRRLVPIIGGPSPGVLTVYAAAFRKR